MSFRHIRGHSRPLSILQRAVASRRLPPAYLFVGPEGVGKKLVALTLAKALNCQGEASPDCCDSCLPCRKIDKGIHPDVRVIEPQESSLKIEQVREAQRDISLRPYEGKMKVYIFDRPERMNLVSESALLKTLEEPVGDSLLILVSSAPDSLLPTLLSRTQRIRFDPLPPAQIANYLVESLSWEKERARLAASLSAGSLGRALRRERQESLSLREEAIEAFSSALQAEMEPILERAELWAKQKDGVEEKLDWLLLWLRDLKVYQITRDGSLLVNRDLLPRLEIDANRIPPAILSTHFQIVQQTAQAIARHANVRLSLEAMFLSMKRAMQEEDERPYAPGGEGQIRGVWQAF